MTCPFCPGGLTVDAATPVPGPDGVAYTCGQVSQFASFLMAEGDQCGVLLMAEALCCPEEPAGPCGFCSAGLTADADTPLPAGSDGNSYTCGQLTEFANLFDSNDDECNEMLLAEPLCCPPSNVCGFCSAGLTADADTPLPAGSDGNSYTCGQLTEFAKQVGIYDAECNEMLLAEPLCCPSFDQVCGFCSEGLTVDADTPLPVAPDGVTYTCSQLHAVVNFVKSGSDECNDMLMAEPICCPSSNFENDTSSNSEGGTSVPIDSSGEIDEPADSADESDPTEPDQDTVQSDPDNASDEDVIGTDEGSDASSLSAFSLASIFCTVIAYVVM